jgi:hypothetical protein
MSQLVFQVLVTTLLTMVLGISAWALKRIIDRERDEDKRYEKISVALAEISQQLWGKDGKNGHASDLRELKKALDRIWDFLSEFDNRVSRIEEKVEIQTPPKPMPRIRPRRRERGDEEED